VRVGCRKDLGAERALEKFADGLDCEVAHICVADLDEAIAHLSREGGPISYEARPSACFQPVASASPLPNLALYVRVMRPNRVLRQMTRCIGVLQRGGS